ncbi:hypothetical protein Tel_13350 [Candidatus Tenderia electrophaga]|jgi:DedD protein|uniref:SPOR domain-containing protein n=1 Tax=Candidatus Tenderia electrophaga TaxID=1748243 RepID=A0A0S2TG01_9GAMM|nr:hypothetical protein Tel_13350 [Candidatus Tenderia electrophaga]
MESAHKQRLIGGIVLLALALILVPSILDFSQDEPDPVQQVEMPEAPDAMQMEVLPLEVWSEPVDPEVDGNERIVEMPEPEQPEPPAQASATPTPKPGAAETKSTPKRDTAKAAPEADSKPVVPAGASAWVVQVASFSDQPKAFKLRDRLRSAGHPSFIERGRSGGATIYRVKVGPVLERTEADQLKKKVDKQTQLNGLVMQYQ